MTITLWRYVQQYMDDEVFPKIDEIKDKNRKEHLEKMYSYIIKSFENLNACTDEEDILKYYDLLKIINIIEKKISNAKEEPVLRLTLEKEIYDYHLLMFTLIMKSELLNAVKNYINDTIQPKYSKKCLQSILEYYENLDIHTDAEVIGIEYNLLNDNGIELVMQFIYEELDCK